MPSSNSSSSSSNKSISDTRKNSMSKGAKNNGTRKINKRVRINSPKSIKTYTLESEEKRWKQASPPKITQKCDRFRRLKFPCVYRGTVFENKEEWDEYNEYNHLRNVSTGHKSVTHYRRTILNSLGKKRRAKKIPPEFRLYNDDTGEIYDMRDLDPGSITYSH